MNKPDEIAEISDETDNSFMHNGWDYSEEGKHVIFGDGTGIDIFLCTQEPYEDGDGRTCISACWEPDCCVDELISPDQWSTLSGLLQETSYAIDADDGEGNVRDGAWEELVEQAKNESHKLFEKINSTREPVEELSEHEKLLKRYARIKAERKPAILNELKNGAKHDFYVDCLKNDCAFDVEVDGTKYEFRPWRYHYLNGGGEAMYRGAESDFCYPQFDEDEILDLIKSAA
jgi:hypothetical protein